VRRPERGGARESSRKRPLLRDPKAAEIIRSTRLYTARYSRGSGGAFFAMRTAILDTWVHAFLAGHPAGTVVEIGTGLNTRSERVDNGQAHWIDLDLPDVIELRRRFFADTARRRMVAASVLDEAWPHDARQGPGPYLFVAEAVLAYLPEDQATQALARSPRSSPAPSSRWTSIPSGHSTASTGCPEGKPPDPARMGATTRAHWNASACT
jgi:O-methyltransferase involved in polyketide biosynthesis